MENLQQLVDKLPSTLKEYRTTVACGSIALLSGYLLYKYQSRGRVSEKWNKRYDFIVGK